MELTDIFLTPVYLLIIYAVAYVLRGRFTNTYTQKYFLPALTVKLIGSIALGLVYYFYYGFGDTINYYWHITVLADARAHSFDIYWDLMTKPGVYSGLTTYWTDRMPWFGGGAEYYLIRLASLLGMLCFDNYTVIALLLTVLTFSGMWAMYTTFVWIRPRLYKEFAFAVLFVPSVFFWGSGLMKDPLCIGALGWFFWGLHEGGIRRRNGLQAAIAVALGGWVLYHIKPYIVLSFAPTALFWIFQENSDSIKNQLVRVLAKPVMLTVGGVAAIFALNSLTSGDSEYNIERIGARSKVTADYVYMMSGEKGSGYRLGELDGTVGGMLKLFPQAVNVTLFRPYLWEVKSPITVLSALESLAFLWVTLRIIFRVGLLAFIRQVTRTPIVLFCFLFSILFAFAVGVSTSNFGTLVRYKIPLIPFYASGLFIMLEDQRATRMKEQKKRVPQQQRALARA